MEATVSIGERIVVDNRSDHGKPSVLSAATAEVLVYS